VTERDDVSCTGSGSSERAAVESGGEAEKEATLTFVDIPIIGDAQTFDESVATEFQKLDELADVERRRQRRRWRQEVDAMQVTSLNTRDVRTIAVHDPGVCLSVMRLRCTNG